MLLFFIETNSLETLLDSAEILLCILKEIFSTKEPLLRTGFEPHGVLELLSKLRMKAIIKSLKSACLCCHETATSFSADMGKGQRLRLQIKVVKHISDGESLK